MSSPVAASALSNDFLPMTEEQIQNAKPLTPGLESLLRSVDLNEAVVMAFRVQEILDKELFIALDTSEETLRLTCKDAFGIDPTKSFAHKRELAKVVKAWKEARVHAETKVKYDSVARAHGEPVSMLTPDWNQLIAAFKQKYGEHLHDTVLPAQSYFEAFEEKLSDGNLRAESLTQVVSVAEQEEQESKKAEPQRHMSLHLDGQLSIQTKRRFTSSAPTTPEQLRVKYKVLANCWLMGQMRQPGRHLFSDLDRNTFADFLDVLLSEKNFLLIKNIGANRVIRPDWSLCMGYEHELRKEALRLAREKGFPIQHALWAAYNDSHHRLENFLNFLKLDKAEDSDGDRRLQQLQSANQKLERKVAELERAMRSRSPRGKGNNRALPAPAQLALPGPSQLSLPAPPTPKGRKGKGKKGKGRGKGATSQGNTIPSFQELMKIRAGERPTLVPQATSQPGVCYKYQSGRCNDTACPRAHICIGCGKLAGYDECKCLRA